MQKKLCTKCQKNPKYSKGLCLSCYKRSFPEKFQLKKTPIKPKKVVDGNSSLTTKAPIKKKTLVEENHSKPKRTWIKKYSKKQKARLDKYKLLRDEYMRLHPICEYEGCKCKADDLHHKSFRHGNSLFEDFMSCCRTHHNYIHEHTKEAIEKGYILKRKTNE